jgi:hypothetical protein
VRWREKPGSTATAGRLLHSVIGAAVPFVAGHLGGYGACAWGFVVSIAAGLAWEMVTPILARKLGWAWAHADLVDFVAFVAGALAGVLLWLALRI